MSNIKAFLQPPIMNETKEVIISERFKDEDGNVVPFVIRIIDQETNNKLTTKATKREKINGQVVRELDNVKYGKLLVDACVVSPNFRDSELCDYYKTADPLDVPGRMLSSGKSITLMVSYQLMMNLMKQRKKQKTSRWGHTGFKVMPIHALSAWCVPHGSS